MIETCAALGVDAGRRDGHPGCWIDADGPDARARSARSACASSGASTYHGIALNVDVDLARLRPHRPVRDARPRVHVDRRASSAGRDEAAVDGRVEAGRVARFATARRADGDRRGARASPAAARRGMTGAARPMSQGLFELRKDAITGWWVATVVDRTFDRERFALAAAPVNDRGDCFNCRIPPGDGIRLADAQGLRVHRRRHRGGGPRAGRPGGPGHDRRRAGRGRVAHGRRAAGRAPAAPLRRQRRHRGPAPALPRPDRRAPGAAGRTQYLQVVQNWGAQAGARTNHLCFDLYDLPQIPHRIAEELGGAARFLIREGECPYCRLVREEVRAPGPPALRGRPRGRLRAVRVALAVRGLGRPAPPRRGLRAGHRPRHRGDRARRSARCSAGSPASLDSPPYNLVLHTAPLKRAGRRDLPLALGDPPAAAGDRGPGAGHRPAGQPGLAGGRGRGAARRGDGGGRRPGTRRDDAGGGSGASHQGGIVKRLGRAPDRADTRRQRSTRGRGPSPARTATDLRPRAAP